MTRSFLTLAIIHFACTAFSQTAFYTVNFNNHAQKRASVKATFSGFPSQNLSMFVHPSQGVPQGEAGFIQNLTATNSLGQALVIKYDDMGEWKVTGKKTETYTVSYEVRLEHDAYAWFEAGGVDEVGYSTSEGIFSTGYSLFLFPAIEDLSAVKDVTVKFDLPADWNASTPWTLTETNSFKVLPDIRFLF